DCKLPFRALASKASRDVYDVTVNSADGLMLWFFSASVTFNTSLYLPGVRLFSLICFSAVTRNGEAFWMFLILSVTLATVLLLAAFTTSYSIVPSGFFVFASIPRL